MERCCYYSFSPFLHPFPPDSDQPGLGGGGCKAVPWGAPYSLAADAGKSDLCGRVERDDCVSL